MSSASNHGSFAPLPESADGLRPFDWPARTRVVFGNGSLERLGELAFELGSKRPLLVTDPGIEEAGHVDRAVQSLTNAGLAPVLFDDVQENPTTRNVEAGRDLARRKSTDLIIGLGGGSAMDTAKGINFLVSNGGTIADYWGMGKATRPMLDFIAVPTTAGTGSEAQSYALIADDKTHQKMACGDPKAAPRIAILDPVVTLSQPQRVSAICGLDAIAHAVESWVTNARTGLSEMFSHEAWRLLSEAFPRVLADPADLEARGRMLWGSHLAGCAIEASMLGAAHSAANPLTAHFDVTHGLAVGTMLPHVIRFNADVVGDAYERLAVHSLNGSGDVRSADDLAEWAIKMQRSAGLPTTLRECGVEFSAIEELAEEASKQWTARFNPRPITAVDFVMLYQRAYNG